MKDYNEMAQSVFARRDQYNAQRKAAMNKLRKGMAGVACCLAVVLVSVGALNGGLFSDPDVPGTYHAMKLPQKEATPSAVEDFAAGREDGIKAADPSPAADMPVTDIPGDTGALTAYDEVWGGSYMDETGRWVVWLTENTPENQQEVFKRNPTLTEENTIFKTADYSYAYLTELMAVISRAMGEDELSFVPTAALRDDRNRVEVAVTTEDPDSIARVMAFDTLGGAIEIRYVSGYTATKDLVKEVVKGPAQ